MCIVFAQVIQCSVTIRDQHLYIRELHNSVITVPPVSGGIGCRTSGYNDYGLWDSLQGMLRKYSVACGLTQEPPGEPEQLAAYLEFFCSQGRVTDRVLRASVVQLSLTLTYTVARFYE